MILAAGQIHVQKGAVIANAERHLKMAAIAAEHGVQLLVFPELSLTGYELDIARDHAIAPEDESLRELRRLAQSSGMTIVVGAPLGGDDGRLHIGAIVLRGDGALQTYTKVHVHESEAGTFSIGPGGALVKVRDFQVGLAICRDASFPEHAEDAALRGAHVYAAGAMITDDAYERKARLLQDYARSHGMATLLANYAGATGGERSAGRSAIWAGDGHLVAASLGNEEEIVIADLRSDAAIIYATS